MRTRYFPCVLPVCAFLFACGPTASRSSADAVTFDTAERLDDFHFAASGDGRPGKWSIIDNEAGRGLARIGPAPNDNRLAFALYNRFSGRDVYVSTRFLTIAGKADQAAGLFVRFRSPDDHYAVRVDALENSVTLYRIAAGQREMIGSMDVNVSGQAWHTLGLAASRDRLTVFFDSKELFVATDRRRLGPPGKVGLWTEANSITVFEKPRSLNPPLIGLSDLQRRITMRYQLAPLHCRPWTLNGISARLIESHYENNYGGALNRLNAISEEIERLDLGSAPNPSLARLKRDEIVALNSTLLHELYFASLGGDGRVLPDVVASAIAKDFGSVDRWRQEFVGIASGLAGGSGWVLLTYVPRDGRLINQIASEHSQSIAGGVPILALDMYEHAFHLEFGANAGAYIAAFMRNIDWSAVMQRYEDAIKVAPPRPLEQKEFGDVPSISVEEVREMMKSGTPVQIIDTRPKHYTTKAQDIMDGAVWRDPERLDDWIGTLSKTEPVVTFCVYGFHIGCQTASALRKAGFDARYMAGGHYAWKAIKGPVKLFE